MMSDSSSTTKLLFNSQCFASPIADPSYPEFRLPPAWYSPFINAMLLPSYSNQGLRWITLLQEYPHRWLDVTTSMCLLRYFAGLAYDAIFDLILDNKEAGISEEHYLTHRNALEDLLDRYIAEVEPLQEAYALHWTVSVLKHAGEPKSKYLEPNHVAELSWSGLDDTTGYVYSELVRLSRRIGVVALSSITGSLNIEWPEMPPPDNTHDEQPYILRLRDHFIRHISDPSNNPLKRFQHFVRTVRRSLPKSTFQGKPDELSLFLYENCPTLRPYFIDPCNYSCKCDSIMASRKESDARPLDYSPFFWAISLSTNMRSDCRIQRQTEAPPESSIELIKHKRPRSLPYLIFYDRKCHVQRDVPDVSMLAKLATFESIRQQENQIIRRNRGHRLRLVCPWESIDAYENDNILDLEAFDAKSAFHRDLLTNYWYSIRRFGFAQKMLAPTCFT